MKYKVAIAGCGEIAKHYRDALEKSENLELSSVFDIREDCAARAYFQDIPFYLGLDAMIQKEHPDILLIAAPPSAHCELAVAAAAHGMSVITEKPMAVHMTEIESMYAAARAEGVRIQCMYHWQAADEVQFLKELLADKKILRIQTTVMDNYTIPGTGVIRDEKIPLSGAWNDSGINILSYYASVLPFHTIQLQSARVREAVNCEQDYYVCREYLIDGIPAEITVDWSTDSREKSSVIECEDGVYEISHSAQTVRKDQKLIFSKPTSDRVASHYENYFKHFSWQEENRPMTEKLHRILLEDQDF